MLCKISFIGYGRATCGKDWYIAPISGVVRVHIIHKGEVAFHQGEKTHVLREGMIYVFPQNLGFRLITDEKTEVDHTFFDFFALPAITANDILEIDPKKHPVLGAAANVLCELVCRKKSAYRELIGTYMNGLLELVKEEVGLSFLDDAVVAGAIEYIHGNFKDKISVSDMAKTYHLEKNVFIRKFKRYTDTTPYQYIKNHRVNYAVSLIKSKRYTLGEIAEMSGYCDQSALSHAVKSTLGLYPEQISE